MMVDYKIQAIPTKYNGCQYRSRLEAKWAAFFDLLGWQFEYEPLDFGRWSPDFAVHAEGRSPLYVEVKPISGIDREVSRKMWNAVPKDQEYNMLLVGLSPFLTGPTPFWVNGEWVYTGSEIGWCACKYPDYDDEFWDLPRLALNLNGKIDIYSDTLSAPLYRVAPAPDTEPPFGWLAHVDRLKSLWGKACNTVQLIARNGPR